jgi:parallel beta-helix repeat protein
MKKYFYIFFFCLILLTSVVCHAADTAYYVDCGQTDPSEDGSFAHPWNSLNDVAGASFLTGDDVFFKRGVTCEITSNSDVLYIDWAGDGDDETDRVIIGCYWDDGGSPNDDCGATPWVDDSNRAIIDGDTDEDSDAEFPNGSSINALEIGTNDYVTVREIKFTYIGVEHNNSSVYIKGGDYIDVHNNWFYRGKGSAVTTTVDPDPSTDGSEYCDVYDNYVVNYGYDLDPAVAYKGKSSVVQITQAWRGTIGLNNHNRIAYNYIENSEQEGIGIAHGSQYNTIEHNIVRDINGPHIYIDGSRYNTIRHNLLFNTAESDSGDSGDLWMFWIECEQEFPVAHSIPAATVQSATGDNEIYGNMIAGGGSGIHMSCQVCLVTSPIDYSGTDMLKNTLIYNNTFIDNNYSIRFWPGTTTASDTVEIKNNISYHSNDGGRVHVSADDITGVTATHNAYNETDDLAPPADTDMGENRIVAGVGDNPFDFAYGGPWDDVVAGATPATDPITPASFKIGEDSDALNVCFDLGGAPYKFDPEGDDRDTNTPWDCGSDELAAPPGELYCGDTISQSTGDGIIGFMHSTGWGAMQSFTNNKAITSGEVRVTFDVNDLTGTPGDSYIRVDDDEDLSADYLCESDAFTVSSTGLFETTIDGCTLANETTYYVAIRHTQGDASNWYRIRTYITDGDQYTGGTEYRVLSSWNFTGQSSTADLLFEIEVCDESAPDPIDTISSMGFSGVKIN